MAGSLAALLTSNDLPVAELCAARLDGELFAIDDCFVPVDQPELCEHRALAVVNGQPDRVIAEQRTAAWIWGATTTPPWPHELCVGTSSRLRLSGSGWASIREVVIEAEDIAVVAGVQVTKPVRTVVDLARFAQPFGEREVRMIGWFVANGVISIQDCIDVVQSRRNLPNKRRALERLALCLSRC